MSENNGSFVGFELQAQFSLFSYPILTLQTHFKKKMMVAGTTCHQVPSWGGGCRFGRTGRPKSGLGGPRMELQWASGLQGLKEGKIHAKVFWKYWHRGQVFSEEGENKREKKKKKAKSGLRV